MATKQDKWKYQNAKRHALNRGVDWHLSFNDWYNWWQQTGHYHERGTKSNQYCMARYRDVGPYALDNIKCITNRENILEARSHTKYLSGSDNRSSRSCICEDILYPTIISAAKKYGVSYQAIAYRLNSNKFENFIWSN